MKNSTTRDALHQLVLAVRGFTKISRRIAVAKSAALVTRPASVPKVHPVAKKAPAVTAPTPTPKVNPVDKATPKSVNPWAGIKPKNVPGWAKDVTPLPDTLEQSLKSHAAKPATRRYFVDKLGQ